MPGMAVEIDDVGSLGTFDVKMLSGTGVYLCRDYNWVSLKRVYIIDKNQGLDKRCSHT